MSIKTVIKENANNEKLWTKNFSFLIVGSFISIAGYSLIDMLFALLVFDLSSSGVLYSIMLVIGNIASILIPIIIGTHLETRRKERVIFSLDFTTAILFFVLAILFRNNLANVNTIIITTFILESINAIYQIAYDSLFPSLVDKGNFGKAYSLNSVLANVAECSAFLAIVIYNFYSTDAVLFVASAFYFIAAVFETRIKPQEGVGIANKEDLYKGNSLKAYFKNYKVVFKMIKETVGFNELVLCSFTDCFRTGAVMALLLPFLETSYRGNSIFGYILDEDYVYLIILVSMGVGEFLCGLFNYRLNMKGRRRLGYLLVFSFVEIITISIFPFLNLFGSSILMLISGIAGVMIMCVYDTGMFERVPEDMRSRFNGVMGCVSAICLILGNITGGIIIDFFRNINVGFFIVSLPEIIILIYLILKAIPNLVSFFSISDKKECTNEE